ncbi:PepSY domain-containing protein [Sphingomonas sp. RS6]
MLVKPVLRACLATLAFACTAATLPHSVNQDRSQGAASERRQRGQNLPSREIERRVIPRMPGAQYLGFDYDPGTDVYTLKFLRNGSVIWVMVDGHSGQVLRRTGD